MAQEMQALFEGENHFGGTASSARIMKPSREALRAKQHRKCRSRKRELRARAPRSWRREATSTKGFVCDALRRRSPADAHGRLRTRSECDMNS